MEVNKVVSVAYYDLKLSQKEYNTLVISLGFCNTKQINNHAEYIGVNVLNIPETDEMYVKLKQNVI